MLKLQSINKIFNEATADEKIALDHINLELKPGDFVTVIGSNGAGKSTMLNMISGALTPDSGDIVVDGKKVTKLPEFKRSELIGRVFQDPMSGTAPTMTIEENLALAYSRNKKRGLKIGVDKKRREYFKQSLRDIAFKFRKSSKCKSRNVIWWRETSAVTFNGNVHKAIYFTSR